MQVREDLDLAPPPDLGYFEMGVVNYDLTPAGGGAAEPFDFGPTNFLTGANSAWSLRFFPDEGTLGNLLLRLVHGADDQFFHGEDSTAFALIRGPVVAVFIPEEEWDGTADFRLFSYYQTTAPAAVSDTSPAMADPMTLYVPEEFPNVALPPFAIGPSLPPSIVASNRAEFVSADACSVTMNITWFRSDGTPLVGAGTIVIDGPTDSGTHQVAAEGGEITLTQTFPAGPTDRTWTLTLTNVAGTPVGAGGSGSVYTMNWTGSGGC